MKTPRGEVPEHRGRRRVEVAGPALNSRTCIRTDCVPEMLGRQEDERVETVRSGRKQNEQRRGRPGRLRGRPSPVHAGTSWLSGVEVGYHHFSVLSLVLPNTSDS